MGRRRRERREGAERKTSSVLEGGRGTTRGVEGCGRGRGETRGGLA